MSLIRINRNPSAKDLRVFSALWIVFLGVLGALAWRKGAAGLAAGLWIASVGIGAVGLAWPAKVRGVYLGAVYAAFPIGFVVSHIILGSVYYLVLTPIGWMARLFGHDPLQRRFDAAKKSYWAEREGSRPPASYFRQY